MSNTTCFSCQDVLSCNDSPLSTTGSVVGILTFVAAIIISAQVWLNSYRDAAENWKEITVTLESQVSNLVRFVQDFQNRVNSVDRIPGSVDEENLLFAAVARVYQSLNDASELLEKVISPTRIGFWGENRWLYRAKFVVREDEIKRNLAKIEKAMEVSKSHIDGFVFKEKREPAPHEEEFRRHVLEMMDRMMNEILSLKNNQSQVSVENEMDRSATN